MKKVAVIVSICLLAFHTGKLHGQHMESVYETVSKIGLGWNLGCVFDGNEQALTDTPGFTVDFENGYDFPPVTEELFRFVAKQGVTAVRIMVMWGEHVDMETMEIRKDWLDRVQEVVDYIVGNNMYCILCFCGDAASKSPLTNWLVADYNNYELISIRFKAIWQRVAERFANYDSYLMFDSFGELVDSQLRFDDTSEENYEAFNLLTQDFVDAIRETGGYNQYRNLLLNIYSGQSHREKFFQKFRMPKDISEDHLMISHHIYTEDFQIFGEQVENDVLPTIHLLNKYFVEKGIPCIAGEIGGLLDMWPEAVKETEREKYYEFLVRETAKYGIPCLAWDDVVDGMDRYYIRLSEPEAFSTMLRNAPVAGRQHWNQSGR